MVMVIMNYFDMVLGSGSGPDSFSNLARIGFSLLATTLLSSPFLIIIVDLRLVPHHITEA